MNKASFHWAFLTLLASSLTGCASPLQMFAKKPQSFEEFKAQKFAKQMPIAGSQTAPSGQVEIAELLHKGHAAFQQGNLPEAQSNYFAVVQRQPSHPVANHRLGVIADRQQDYLSAQRHYIAALQASPRDANLLNDVGYSFLLQSRYAESEQYLQAALRVNPTQSNAINNLGLLYAKQGQAERAMAMFRRTNSEAEAQAKLARLLPSGTGAATPPATMLAQNPWPPQNTMNPPPGWNGSPDLGNQQWGGSPMGPNNLPPIQQAGANFPAPSSSDPNLPEATRTLEEQMKQARRQAVTERQARDLAERQRREFAVRQLREEEFARSNAVNPNYSQPTDPNRWNPPPGVVPNPTPNPNRPIVVGPPPSNPNANPHNNGWEHSPNGATPPNGYAGSIPSQVPGAPPINQLPSTRREPMPSNGAASPLDTMQAWPPQDFVPATTPNNPPTGVAAWPTAMPSGPGDDPARAASRWGMSAGPGNMFQITPGPTAAPNSSQNNSPNNRPNNFATPNGVAPTTSPNWPANPNRQDYEVPPGEPPTGSFGPGNFSTPTNSQPPTQTAPQDQLPPSEWYQTPNRFGFAPNANNTAAQPMSYSPNPGTRGAPPPAYRSGNPQVPNPMPPPNGLERGNSRGAMPDQFGTNQWEQGPRPGNPGSQTSAPSTQGFLPTTFGDNALLEYEQMIQRQNAETNQIQQQLDAQRQLPGSENYFRSRPQRQ